MSREQKELFDGFVRLRKCRKCKRTLHIDPKNNYQTREAGLCFACLRAFDASNYWTVEGFLNGSPITEEEQTAIAEFEAAVEEFRSLMNSEPMIAFRTKVKQPNEDHSPNSSG